MVLGDRPHFQMQKSISRWQIRRKVNHDLRPIGAIETEFSFVSQFALVGFGSTGWIQFSGWIQLELAVWPLCSTRSFSTVIRRRLASFRFSKVASILSTPSAVIANIPFSSRSIKFLDRKYQR